MYKQLLTILLVVLSAIGMSAQSLTDTGGVTAKVVSRGDKAPIVGASIKAVQGEDVIAQTYTNEEGSFLFNDLFKGNYVLLIEADGYLGSEYNVVVENFVRDLIFISLTPNQEIKDLDASNYAEFDMEDSGYSDSPAILYGNDVYTSVAGYGFSSVRFKNRGYKSESQDVYLNGVRMNDALTGYSPFSLWSGLNEATRTKETTVGLDPADNAFGGYNGVTNIPALASSVRSGLRLSLLTNSALYRFRFMASYASGMLDNGWSYAFNVSARLGGNDWVEGVYYRSFAYYASVEKKLNDVHKLGFTFFGTPGTRGAQNASTQEVYDLVGSNTYNSNWGYQNGKVRNARVRNTHEPVAFLTWTATPSRELTAQATILYRFGKNGYTALDWYDSQDPRPDYYRYLPSYFYMEDSDYGRTELQKSGWATEAWTYNINNVQHIQWDKLYDINVNNVTSYGSRSKYVLEERRTDQNDLNLNGNIKWKQSRLLTVTGGADLKWNKTEYYKIVNDLLGGDYYVNIDQYAERDYTDDEAKIQNDLNYYAKYGAAQRLAQGDKYGYDYYANVRKASVWAKTDLNFGDGFSAYAAAEVGYTELWREGLVRKGLFAGLDEDGNEYLSPDTGLSLTTYDSAGKVISSYGESEHAQFLTYKVKAGLSKYFTGGHRVYANFGYFNDAPTFTQIFISPRTRNTITPNITTIKTLSADINYTYSNNGYDIRVTGFYANIMDQSQVMSFYDDSQNSFTNFAMSGINERHMGVEIGAKAPLPVTGLSIQGVLSWGEYVYTSNPRMTQTIDNSAETVFDNEIVPYWKSHPVYKKDADGAYITDENGSYIVDHYQKHYVPSTPQLAASIGLNYRSRTYWFINVDLNYFGNSYLDMNPLYRTDMAVAGPDGTVTPIEVEYMAAQEKFDPVLMLNASVGKSWYINYKYNFGFSLQLNNALNNTCIKTGGYEQTRLITSDSGERYYKFDPKYFYTSGINYMLNLYFKF